MTDLEKDCLVNGLSIYDARILAYKEYEENYNFYTTREKRSATQRIGWLWRYGKCSLPILFADRP